MIRQYIKQNLEPLVKVVDEFPWEDKESYCTFLAQTYFYVCHSTRLLAVSAGRFNLDQTHLHKRYIDHIREEKNHEMLALKDLDTLGAKIEDYKEMPVTSAFFESQYYKIEHQDPTALMGYILALEGISAYKMCEVYKTLCKTYGEKASNFIRLHADEDVDHLEKAFKQVEQLSPLQVEYIKKNFIQSCYLYGQIINESNVLKRKQSSLSPNSDYSLRKAA